MPTSSSRSTSHSSSIRDQHSSNAGGSSSCWGGGASSSNDGSLFQLLSSALPDNSDATPWPPTAGLPPWAAQTLVLLLTDWLEILTAEGPHCSSSCRCRQLLPEIKFAAGSSQQGVASLLPAVRKLFPGAAIFTDVAAALPVVAGQLAQLSVGIVAGRHAPAALQAVADCFSG